MDNSILTEDEQSILKGSFSAYQNALHSLPFEHEVGQDWFNTVYYLAEKIADKFNIDVFDIYE